MMESMSMMKGKTSKVTLESVFLSCAKIIGNEPRVKHSRIMREINQFNRTFSVRIKTHLSKSRSKVPPKPYEPTKEKRQSHEAKHCPFRAWCEICVKAKSPDGKHTKQLGNLEHIPVIEFDYAFATDTLGDPNKQISMMVATDSIHGSILAVVARRKCDQDDFVMQSFQNYTDLVEAELKCDQVPSTLDVANTLIKRCQSTILMVTATPTGSKGSFGTWRTSNFDDSGTASSIS